MTSKGLLAQALAKFTLGLMLVGVLLFLPAGSFEYWQAWLLIAILFAPMFAAGIVMLAKSPALLQNRLDAKEKEGEQRKIIAASAIMFIAGFVLSGLGFRLGWPMLP